MNGNIGIIGAGPSGITAAIWAARAGCKVTLLEGNERIGKKILSTGNGKCNLGNSLLDDSYYFSEDEHRIKFFLNQFGTKETIDFFQSLGLMITSKNGYLYPLSEQAASVLDVLRYSLERFPNVEIITDCKINKISKVKSGYLVYDGKKSFSFSKVIIACGGCAATKTGSDGSGYDLAKMLGHRIIPVVPALVQLKCCEDWFKSVSGVRVDTLITVIHKNEVVSSERGELQLTDYGISGIPVFQISRHVNYLLRKEKSVEVHLDFMPNYEKNSFAERMLKTREISLFEGSAEAYFTGILNKKIMLLLLKLSGIKTTEQICNVDIKKIKNVFTLCRDLCVHVNGSNSFDNAQVCAGGVALSEVSDQLESLLNPGLFFAGEILDVDGKCGGYNLQWAWCSGYIAGKAASIDGERRNVKSKSGKNKN